ncbi:hypothetical protein MMC22_005983 [Lobaria immixta]|nr:hypothetical protein [Lobaria immixta]
MSNSSSPHDYFAAYPNFIPEPHLPLLENFNRLANAQGWRKKRCHKERQIYLLGQYTIHLGEISTGKLQKWQNLCRELRVDPIPTSITKCKKVLKTNVHVNIIDLMDSRRWGTVVTTFRSRKALVEYTRSSEKTFPLRQAKKDELLEILLRHIR